MTLFMRLCIDSLHRFHSMNLQGIITYANANLRLATILYSCISRFLEIPNINNNPASGIIN